MRAVLPAPWLMGPDHPGLPPDLRHVEPPVGPLWVRGNDPVTLGRRIAIIGARDATAYGLEIARGLAADLAAAGLCIVSGMARGCDAEAHRGALDAGGTTIAVLATGVDVPYPARNARLYERIVERGAVVSERPPGASAHRNHFMERNRIIAALADSLIIVQGRHDRSGARGTLGVADDLGHTVFAVPGDVRSALSGLPHQMLRDGAVVCARADDVLEELGLAGDRDLRALPDDLSATELAVADALAIGPAAAGVIARRASLGVSEVLRALSMLELRRLVARSAGTYRRC